ncbi:MAG: divalent-cation tolerance protein CutA [Rhodospirillaceae bacterium]|jgi:periplasmic divalent cation tolerance protein|nr:divalent-cation tolerance protein CutA [Rhodospirillaceae bacterium]MBT5458246.1 divalent-cation tolerance protein CutA [Rhodospirillaceae bacterium]
MPQEQRLIYMTAGSADEASAIGEALVGEHLAACVNLIEGMRSIYRWQGQIQRDTETVIIAKTTEDRVAALTERVKALHSYDTPCIVVLPIEGGNAEFLKWISEQVK